RIECVEAAWMPECGTASAGLDRSENRANVAFLAARHAQARDVEQQHARGVDRRIRQARGIDAGNPLSNLISDAYGFVSNGIGIHALSHSGLEGFEGFVLYVSERLSWRLQSAEC